VAELVEESDQGIQGLVTQLPWAHNVILIQKVKDTTNRRWYAKQALCEGWSRDTLALMIKSKAHERQGRAVDNFDRHLPEPRAQLARDTLKDPYVFHFLTLDAPFRERELEMGLIEHLERFLMELGAGFAFVGRQVRLAVGGAEFCLDLLFLSPAAAVLHRRGTQNRAVQARIRGQDQLLLQRGG
jgi:predicted nuclease of restriction endonuclease-like (RecB) superfamily